MAVGSLPSSVSIWPNDAARQGPPRIVPVLTV